MYQGKEGMEAYKKASEGLIHGGHVADDVGSKDGL